MQQRCPTCNAPIQDDVETCTFCGTMTAYGQKAKADRAKRDEAAARQRADDQRKAELNASAAKRGAIEEAHRAANRSLMWSLFGLLACCLPLGPLIGFATARKARELAVNAGTSTTHAGVASGIGIGGVLLSIGLWVGIGLIIKAEEDRKQQLRALISKADAEPELPVGTACAMTELELLNARYEGFDHLNAELTCGSRLLREGDEARLLDSHFTESSKRVDVVACFRRGAKWTLTQVRPDERCDQPPPVHEDKKKRR